MSTQKVHIAIAVADLEASIAAYSLKFGRQPELIRKEAYALWRTDLLNFSISVDPENAGHVRHLGFEDASSTAMTAEYDVNGLLWERFTYQQQRTEIDIHYPADTKNDK
ncbi:hypothetical protein NADE_002634 [Nannochloris sp. 'desiccata']|nr:hypothetical protein KSW81_005649 [Chlorella desiccata (nom. nud.)]KAH7623445.1 hypothetical protein NADE_002634 [Chlorella desiccata (nom. nud.)]